MWIPTSTMDLREQAAPVVQKIDEINQRIENLKSSLEKE